MIEIMIDGLLMALADSVPGVSGGTIAFILGYYEKFMGSLHDLFGKDNDLRIKALIYLVKFALGWVIGIVGSILILTSLFEKHVYVLSSAFLGLTLAAIPFIAYDEINSIKGKYGNLVFTFIGAFVVVAMTWLRVHNVGLGNIDFLNLSAGNYVYLMITGLVAICSMLLPGVSGSSVLLIFGIYVPTINAVKELLHFHLAYLPAVIAIGVGVIIGVLLASKYIKQALNDHRSMMIYLILGLMLGSLYAIINGATTLEIPKPALSLASVNWLALVIGAGIIVVLELAKIYKNK